MGASTGKSRSEITNMLAMELANIESIQSQNPETGVGLNSEDRRTYLHEYTNRLFGAPFQLLDSVDRRFTSVNEHLGNEYLRNMILNSPILHIRPGLPRYTGGNEAHGIANHLKKIYFDGAMQHADIVQSLLGELASSVIFGQGSHLQQRMYGFRETYYEYMQHVNYMCRSCAVFMALTDPDKNMDYPNGTFTSEGFQEFSTMKWENYRMMAGTRVESPYEYLTKGLKDSTFVGVLGSAAWNTVGAVTDLISGNFFNNIADRLSSIKKSWTTAQTNTLASTIAAKVQSVQFMVDPVQYTENLTNQTKDSMIESTIDGLNDIGSEIAFITNSDADFGMLKELTKFLGNVTEDAGMSIAKLAKPVTGGFLTNLFSGALGSIKGQKMIYPSIYSGSKSTMNYNFSMVLTTPYGDRYNYYMNILVPLMHLIALVAPRMVTSNSIASPYLVQAYMPGQCTCQLGIISNMNIVKNPNQDHVSVDGFPLTIKVEFTIEELYNAMSISPANDPGSFLFNETLNDYMANLSGLIPSIDTYTIQRKTMFENLGAYISNGEFINDAASTVIEAIENKVNPFAGR